MINSEWTRYVVSLLSTESRLRACLTRFTRNFADTDELLQETYARLLSIDVTKMQDIRSVGAFALVTARHIAIDWLKHKKTVGIEYVPDSDPWCEHNDHSPTEDLVNCSQEIEQLITSVQRLPPRCGQVFTLRKIFGFSQNEVAQRLGISVNTVEQHMQRAAQGIARELRGEKPRFSVVYPFKKRTRRMVCAS